MSNKQWIVERKWRLFVYFQLYFVVKCERGIDDAKDMLMRKKHVDPRLTNKIIVTLIPSKFFKEILEANSYYSDSKAVCYVWVWHLVWLCEAKSRSKFILELDAEGSTWF